MAGASSAGTVTSASSLLKEVYNPKAVIPHAALLDQASAHCPIFMPAAYRRSLGRDSVPVRPVTLSGRLPVVALVSRYLTNKLIGREALPKRKSISSVDHAILGGHPVLDQVSPAYPGLRGRFLTCYSPVRRSATTGVATRGSPARLACIRHAASVRPEPGSNSPTRCGRPGPEGPLRFDRGEPDGVPATRLAPGRTMEFLSSVLGAELLR